MEEYVSLADPIIHTNTVLSLTFGTATVLQKVLTVQAGLINY
jgi:hypothetical protein